MNDFFLYEQLCALEGIGKQYPQGHEYAKKVRAIADQLASQTYRVAVIGEFKRGKSSLINALLRSSILPTDILPITAAINRVVYGEKARIQIDKIDYGGIAKQAIPAAIQRLLIGAGKRPQYTVTR